MTNIIPRVLATEYPPSGSLLPELLMSGIERKPRASIIRNHKITCKYSNTVPFPYVQSAAFLLKLLFSSLINRSLWGLLFLKPALTEAPSFKSDQALQTTVVTCTHSRLHHWKFHLIAIQVYFRMFHSARIMFLSFHAKGIWFPTIVQNSSCRQ